MRSSILILVLAALPAAAQEDGFKPLFDGKTIDGWHVAGGRGDKDKEAWSWNGEILAAKAGSGWLQSDKQYGNFILRLDWRLQEGGNSGVFLRIPDKKFTGSPSGAGMEIQILDDTSSKYVGKIKPYQFSGSIYGVVPPSKNMYKGTNQWNSYEITCQGDLVRVVFNGEKVSEADMSKEEKLRDRPRRGFLGLQNHGSPVEFRNPRIKLLD
jgi:hypothetical protein